MCFRKQTIKMTTRQQWVSGGGSIRDPPHIKWVFTPLDSRTEGAWIESHQWGFIQLLHIINLSKPILFTNPEWYFIWYKAEYWLYYETVL